VGKGRGESRLARCAWCDISGVVPDAKRPGMAQNGWR
jgi:hypothetical protein